VSVTKADVKPGTQVGSSDFIIETQSTPFYDGYVVADNTGSKFTGKNRLMSGINLNSPLNLGDKFSVSGLISNGEDIKNFNPSKNDSVISHFIDLPKLDVKKHIFSCHETDVWPMTYRDLSKYNKIHYVSKWQQEWHGTKKTYFLLPNILEDLKANDKPNGKIGGVIGSIDRNKRTHISIQKALEDGCEKVLLFGSVTDNDYYDTMKHMIGGNVVLVGQVEDKQAMYDMVTDVYQNSIRETWGYVAGECQITGT
jgi:hypothetical protein